VNSFFPIVVTQAILEVGTSVLIYVIIRRLFQQGAFGIGSGDKLSLTNNTDRLGHITGLVGVLGFAFYLPEWPYAIGFQSEPVYMFLLTAAMGVHPDPGITSRSGLQRESFLGLRDWLDLR